MKKTALFQIAAIALALAFFAQPATAAVGAASLRAFSPADANFIFYSNLGSVFNNDAAATHNVIASDSAVVAGPVVITRTTFGSGNGQLLSCTVVARNLSTGALFGGGASTGASGLFSLPVTVNITAGGTYAVTVLCTLPRVVGSAALVFGTI
jgi:hypothetical protein